MVDSYVETRYLPIHQSEITSIQKELPSTFYKYYCTFTHKIERINFNGSNNFDCDSFIIIVHKSNGWHLEPVRI